MFILDNKWCFLHIPKTSGTNLSSIVPSERVKKYEGNIMWDQFWKTDPNGSKLPPDYISKFIKGRFVIVSHAPLLFWENQKIINNEHKIFTIVRNPYTRFLSWFNEVKRTTKFNMTFDEFIFDEYYEKLLKIVPYNCFSNKINQIDYFLDSSNKIRLDRYYKFESDLVDLQKDFSLNDINRCKYNSFLYYDNYEDIYNEKSIEWIQKTFKRDFEYFNYDINPFW